MKITIDKIMALNPCYSVERVTDLFSVGNELETLLFIPSNDARWLLSNLLTVPNRIIWAESCAKRAKEYAASYASYAAAAASYAAASYAASYAAAAASYAAASYAASYADAAAAAASYASYAAADAAAKKEEEKKAFTHALQLIADQPE